MPSLKPTMLEASPAGRRIYSDDAVEVLLEMRGAIAGRLMVVCRHPSGGQLDAAIEGRLRKVAQRAVASLCAAGLSAGPHTARLHRLHDGRRVLVSQPQRAASGVHSLGIAPDIVPDIDSDIDMTLPAVRFVG